MFHFILNIIVLFVLLILEIVCYTFSTSYRTLKIVVCVIYRTEIVELQFAVLFLLELKILKHLFH